jgi:transglutaminase-like putative cysteine protease
MRRLKIEHSTHYDYSSEVDLLPHTLLVRPREGHDIRIESSTLTIAPANRVKWHRDAYGNSVGVVTFLEPAAALTIASETVIQHYEEAPLDFVVEDYAVNYPFQYNPHERIDLIPYEMPVFPWDSTAIREWLEGFWHPGNLIETYVLLDQLNKAIAENFEYKMREEPGVQSPAVTLEAGRGSCRDFATLFIEACRYIGLAARFVSGYLHAPGVDDHRGATHAWSEVYLPGAGWKGFDSTTGKVAGSDNIAVAVHRHPGAVPPVAGSFVAPGDCTSTMSVTVQVTEV